MDTTENGFVHFKFGDAVRIQWCGRETVGSVILASPNGQSLMLQFDGAIGGAGTGMYVGLMPVLWSRTGQRFFDLKEGETVEISKL